MKTPKADSNDKDMSDIIKNFNKNIIYFYKKRDEGFEYLKNQDEVINFKLGDEISFGFFYLLDLLIKYGGEEIINFTYDFNLVEKAYEFLVDKATDKRMQIMGIKIVDDLIYNYKISHEEEEYFIYQEKIKKILAKIQDLYQNIFTKSREIFKDFNLPEDFIKLDIKKILLKIITDLFNKSDFEDYESINSILYAFDIDTIFIDEDIIEEIKKIINSNDYQDKFLLTKADLIDLENKDIKMSNTFEKKINFLYSLIVGVLNDPSNIENFPFLIKTSSILDDIIKEKGKKEILSKLDKGIRIKFSKIIDIFEDNKSSLSTISLKTNASTVKIEKKKEKKKRKNNKGNKINDKKKDENVHPKKITISKYFKIVISQKNFAYDINSLKLFKMFEDSSQEMGKIYDDDLPLREFNLIPKSEKERLYSRIYNTIDNLKKVPDELWDHIDYKTLIEENNDKILFVVRCEEIVNLFHLEKSDTLLSKIKGINLWNFIVFIIKIFNFWFISEII